MQPQWSQAIREAWAFHGFATPVGEFLALVLDCRKKLVDTEEKYGHESRGLADCKAYHIILQREEADLLKKSPENSTAHRDILSRMRKNQVDYMQRAQQAHETRRLGSKYTDIYNQLKTKAQHAIVAHNQSYRLPHEVDKPAAKNYEVVCIGYHGDDPAYVAADEKSQRFFGSGG
ncbi:MAG: hypothetical protein Q9166_000240 [cf. Caloplaca sp. 2 TL-2023]